MTQSDNAVFVVDDHPAVGEALGNLIRWLGMRCEALESAAAFPAAERPDAPSCLVLDITSRESAGWGRSRWECGA
jgi:FixJ family two-component response regulator